VDGSISHIEVVLEMSSIEGKTEKPYTLKAPVIFAGVDGIADRIEQLRVTDDEGNTTVRKVLVTVKGSGNASDKAASAKD